MTERPKSDPKPNSVLNAIAGLTCLLLFSALNAYQKSHLKMDAAGPWLLGRGSFPVCLLLLGGFSIFTYRALATETRGPASPGTEIPRPAAVPAKFDPLLALRGFACLMVLYGHGMSFIFLSPHLIPSVAAGSPVWLVTAAPEAGVWVFFTLSGYLIGKGFVTGRYTMTRERVAKFYSNRLLRILPVYWATLTVFSAVFIPAIFMPANLPAFCSMLLFNLNGHLPYLPIKALWSLATEMEFYAAAPLCFILLAYAASKPFLALLLAVILMAASVAARAQAFHAGGLTLWENQAYTPLFMNLDLFVTGMAASYLVFSFQRRRRLMRHGLAIGACTLVALYLINTYLRVYGVLVPRPFITGIFTCLSPSLTASLTATAIFFFESAKKEPIGARALRVWRLSEFFGILTYAAYCCHEPIFLEFKINMPAPPTIILSLISCTATILFVFFMASLMYFMIERPFERLKSI